MCSAWCALLVVALGVLGKPLLLLVDCFVWLLWHARRLVDQLQQQQWWWWCACLCVVHQKPGTAHRTEQPRFVVVAVHGVTGLVARALEWLSGVAQWLVKAQQPPLSTTPSAAACVGCVSSAVCALGNHCGCSVVAELVQQHPMAVLVLLCLAARGFRDHFGVVVVVVAMAVVEQRVAVVLGVLVVRLVTVDVAERWLQALAQALAQAVASSHARHAQRHRQCRRGCCWGCLQGIGGRS